jgi:hypothetical protein
MKIEKFKETIGNYKETIENCILMKVINLG